MPATAESLRDLHQLHQRARALRDRLSSGPKTLAARQAALATRQAELEAARKALQDAKMHVKKHEHSLKGIETKIDDLKVKLNQVKKNEEYKALQNQIAHDNTAKGKIEEDILLSLEEVETKSAEVARLEAELQKFAGEVAALKQQLDQQTGEQAAQLRELETALTHSEGAIPQDQRDRYRRIVARYGADALAACEDSACHGCYTSVTPQMMNELINGESLTFCLSCGRLLYYIKPEPSTTKRTAKAR
jgi:predicted  nucleic acid-binding Zn-ribbon protein